MVSGRLQTSLADRTKALCANIVLFYIGLYVASGNVLPTGGLESVWFLSGLALWFLALLSAPWFVPPKDALSNSIGAMAILVTADLAAVGGLKPHLEALRWVGVFYCTLVMIGAVAALFAHDKNKRSPIGRFSFRTTDTFGQGELLYTPPALISIVGAYQNSPIAVAWLAILWTLVIIGRPAERILAAWKSWREETDRIVKSPAVGMIERIDHPGIVRVRLARRASWKPNHLYTAAMSDGDQHYVLALFSQVQGLEVMATGLCVAQLQEKLSLDEGEVIYSHSSEKTAQFIETLSGTPGAELVGFTVENSNIGVLRFEVSAASPLGEGEVVFVRLNGRDVFYQILDAQTAEESFDQNPRGTHIVNAVQLGCYSLEGGFTKYGWLSTMNAPVFWAKARTFPAPTLQPGEFVVGTVPSTNIGVTAKLDDLVQFHTAVLGMTGTGKTELALDIVREAVKNDFKVFCVDFTGEYKVRLATVNPIVPSPTQQQINDLDQKLFAVETGSYGAPQEKAALKACLTQIRGSVETQINSFLTGAEKLAILELTEISNTKATLRITEQYLSTIMAWARKHRQARKILIVLEEAHTIIPESFSSGFDNETQWVVSRIGQIALQGRKYGVGLLVISQRTALVSKTILSQCNTFLTHSLIDQTSLTFLESVYSGQHVRTIPNLGRFQFMAAGKAIGSEHPVLLGRPFDQAKKDASDALRQTLQSGASLKKSSVEGLDEALQEGDFD
ncbi:DUF87 domain-containing protein [Bradyrhizobium sp. LMTR 3]|uniref:ATP-binding protein n=1 Tax=Bradyrhizobium sp. LMTR 3 TaxID=189873 RepID=UPI000810B1C3|nr:DUF87 domain-containing protein [Bradyrhizobium sp. LMTR 3]OCK59854.1 hypothetical protein LMTR3_19735 [Bradyrhizobium sp. LMTR 3]